VIYHFVIEGSAIACLADGESISLEAGDVVIFPHGDPHLMTSGAIFERAETDLRNRQQSNVAGLDSSADWRRRHNNAICMWIHVMRSTLEPANP
jgi:hypothetical protein